MSPVTVRTGVSHGSPKLAIGRVRFRTRGFSLLEIVVVVALIVLKVVPAFGSFYEGMSGAELPLSTRVLVSISNFAGTYFSLMALTVLAAFFVFWAWL